MKRQILLSISLAALLLFVAVQIFMIRNTWKQREEILLMRYKNLSREALSLLISKKKSNGFEKAMDVIEITGENKKGRKLSLPATAAYRYEKT